MESRIELGSEFNLSLNSLKVCENNIFEYLGGYYTHWYDYGRTAISKIPIADDKRILLPEYVCESVINCFDKRKIDFYKINEDLSIDLDNLVSRIKEDTGLIFVINYFGYLQSEDDIKEIIKVAEDNGIIVVEDNTQSIFSEHELLGDYGLSSIRKWMPIPNGAVLYTKHDMPVKDTRGTSTDNERIYAAVLKDLFLKGEYDTNLKYREIFEKCEENIGHEEGKYMSDFAKYIASCVDVDVLQTTRIRNYKRLEEGLLDLGIKPIREINSVECPLVFPIRVPNRNEFRKYLMENRIYCAVHWPFDGFCDEERCMAISNSENIISLPIDQRYGKKEIDYLINTIKNYRGDLLF